MDERELDQILNTALLADASDALDRVADDLIALHDAWRQTSADTSSLRWLGGLIVNLGWWSGRMREAAQNATAAAWAGAGAGASGEG